MPLDALPNPGFRHSSLPALPQNLDQTERDAAVHFVGQLHTCLASLPQTRSTMLLLVRLSTDLKNASARLVLEDERVSVTSGETSVAWVLQGVPQSAATRRTLAIRLASVAAVTWRQHCQIRRLGFLAA